MARFRAICRCGGCLPERPLSASRNQLKPYSLLLDRSRVSVASSRIVPGSLMRGNCTRPLDWKRGSSTTSRPWLFLYHRLAAADLVGIGGGKAEPGAPMAVLGPGTGLGVACRVPGAGKYVVIASEGGHATLAGTCDREDEIIRQLRRRFGHVSAERVVSGDGLENIYQAIVALDGLILRPEAQPTSRRAR